MFVNDNLLDSIQDAPLKWLFANKQNTKLPFWSCVDKTDEIQQTNGWIKTFFEEREITDICL